MARESNQARSTQLFLRLQKKKRERLIGLIGLLLCCSFPYSEFHTGWLTHAPTEPQWQEWNDPLSRRRQVTCCPTLFSSLSGSLRRIRPSCWFTTTAESLVIFPHSTFLLEFNFYKERDTLLGLVQSWPGLAESSSIQLMDPSRVTPSDLICKENPK